MVERVQVLRVAPSARWCAAAASGYSLAAGIVLLGTDASEIAFFASIAGVFLALTLLPQPFRRNSTFRAACWIAVGVSMVVQFTGIVFFGGCFFLPTTVMLILAALRPPRPASVAPDPRSWQERWELTARRVIAGSAVAALLVYVAAVTR
ncbi:hypothetical protein ACQPZJ_28860 [Actinoplanes sp. CA-054009]